MNNGRLVWNHSTHIPGLIAVLEKLITYQGITTVTPGVLSRSKGQTWSQQISTRILQFRSWFNHHKRNSDGCRYALFDVRFTI